MTPANYAGLMPDNAVRPENGLDGGLLASLRVLDLCDADGDAVTRILADFGADVLKVEPPCGCPSTRTSAARYSTRPTRMTASD